MTQSNVQQSKIKPESNGCPMSENQNYTETFTEIGGRIRYRRMIPILPDFCTVTIWLTKSFVEWNKTWKPQAGQKYLDYAVNAILKRNGIS